jgi:hypothetical protein
MSRGLSDPNGVDQAATAHDHEIAELERYAMANDSDAPRGLAERIMAAIELEPAPRRGFLAWMTRPSSPGGGSARFLRVGALGATLALAVAGALFAGQLAGLVRDVGGDATPTPSVTSPPSSVPSPSASPSLSLESSPPLSPEPTTSNGVPGEVPSAQPTPLHTANATPEDTAEETSTARPSPTTTVSPSPTPTPAP